MSHPVTKNTKLLTLAKTCHLPRLEKYFRVWVGGRGITTSDTRILLVGTSRATSNWSKTESMMIIPLIPAFKLPSPSNKCSRPAPQGRERHHHACWHTRPSLLPPYSQCSPLPLVQPLPIPHPWLPGLHCSDGLATHTHYFTGRDGHPTTAIRIIFATCNSAQFLFMKPPHGSSLFSGQRPKSSAWPLSPYQ